MSSTNEAVTEERPIRKMREHLEDARIHLHNSNVSEARKTELDGLMVHTLRCIEEAAGSAS